MLSITEMTNGRRRRRKKQRRRGTKYVIGVQGGETTPLYLPFPKVVNLWERKEGRKQEREEEERGGRGKMNSLRLKELSNSDLYRRRQERPDSYGSTAGERFR
ncbi:hypothetical protein D4764_01G0004360 [Takifugu flavidus]|uniref:Uncharacterized protein n=1 Tax=Takifugu flavidus TaxID=433684 RepID=A0A5C6PP54_9TELE|nr:hypothetical protein D4764_01G0004360 [Takifugu flavidus]